MADLTPIGVAVAVVIALIPTLRWALASPVSSGREIAGYILLTTVGVIFLLVQGVSALAPDGSGVLAYLGAGAAGTLLIDAATKTATAIPGGTTPPPTPPPG